MIKKLQDRLAEAERYANEHAAELRRKGGLEEECENERQTWLEEKRLIALKEFEREIRELIASTMDGMAPEQRTEFLLALQEILESHSKQTGC